MDKVSKCRSLSSQEHRMTVGEYIRKKAIIAVLDEVMMDYGHMGDIRLIRNKIANELKQAEYGKQY